MKRTIANKQKFKDINFGEDTEWAERLDIKKETKTDKVLYHYRSDHAKSATLPKKFKPKPITIEEVIPQVIPQKDLLSCVIVSNGGNKEIVQQTIDTIQKCEIATEIIIDTDIEGYIRNR